MCRFPSDTHSKCFPVAQIVKNLPAMQGAWVWFLGREDPLDKGMATYSSNFAWRFPWREEPGRLQSMGLQRVRQDGRTNTSQLAHTHMYTNSLLPCARTRTHTPQQHILYCTHTLKPWCLPSTKEPCSHVREEKFKWKSDPVITGFATHTFLFFCFFPVWKTKEAQEMRVFPGGWGVNKQNHI